MSKHTAGPWTFDDLSLVNVASFSVKAGGYSIAAVWAKRGRSHPTAESIAQAKVNARLIAAAPELLAALKAARPIVQNFADGNEATYEMVCEAIAKAGRT